MLMSFGVKPEERILNFIALVDCIIYSDKQLSEGKWQNCTFQYGHMEEESCKSDTP
jgi:hypothetical protein